MATPARANVILPCVVTGATWDGFSISLASTGTSLADGLASASLTLYDSAGVSALVLSSGTDITIDDAPTWALTVKSITPLSLDSGTYSGSIRMVSATSEVRKWVKVQLPILPE